MRLLKRVDVPVERDPQAWLRLAVVLDHVGMLTERTELGRIQVGVRVQRADQPRRAGSRGGDDECLLHGCREEMPRGRSTC